MLSSKLSSRELEKIAKEYKELLETHLTTMHEHYGICLLVNTPILFLQDHGFSGTRLLIALTFFQLKYDELMKDHLWTKTWDCYTSGEKIRLFVEQIKVVRGPTVLLDNLSWLDEEHISYKAHKTQIPILNILLHHFRKQTFSSRSIIWRAKNHVRDFILELKDNEKKNFYISGRMRYSHEDFLAYYEKNRKRIRRKSFTKKKLLNLKKEDLPILKEHIITRAQECIAFPLEYTYEIRQAVGMLQSNNPEACSGTVTDIMSILEYVSTQQLMELQERNNGQKK